jgi:hypothetical protein
MHFEFIRGGSNPSRKTGNLSSPPMDRLVPLRDLAKVFGCTEGDLERWAEGSAMVAEPLLWRGVEIRCLTLPDAFRLHWSMRATAEEPTESVELRRALQDRSLALAQAQGEVHRLQARIQQRDEELKALMEGVGGLERAVAERANVHRDLAEVQALYVQSQAQQSELTLRLSRSEQAQQELQDSLLAAQTLLEKADQGVAQAAGELASQRALTDELHGRMEQAAAEHERERSEVASQHAQQLAEARAQFAQQQSEAMARHEQALAETAAQHEQDLNEASAVHRSELVQVTAAHALVLARAEETHAEELEKVAIAHGRQMGELRAAHEKELQNNAASNASQLDEALERARKAEQAALAEQHRNARHRSATKLRKLRNTHAAALAVERNLERYCNRLERKLRGES